MNISKKMEQLLIENEELRTRLEEAEETLRAIREGEVDALVVSGAEGEQLYTLKGADYSYRILLETMEEGAATLGGDGTILYCNGRMAAMLRTPLNKVIGCSLEEYMSDGQGEILREMFQNGGPLTVREELCLKTADGTRVPALLSFGSMQIGDVRGACLTATDLTVQKRAEENLRKAHDELEIRVQERTQELVFANQALQSEISERKRAEEALRLSEERWATTLASIGDAVIATDVAGRITFMNAVAEELTGWALQEASQKPVPEVFRIINEHTRQTVQDPVAKVLKAGGIVGLANHTILVKKDGGEVPIDDSGAPIRDKDGRIIGVVLVFRDITERRMAEAEVLRSRDEMEFRVQERTAELAGANKELREEMSRRERAELQLRQAQKMEAIGTLAGGIAHDLNNIFAPVVINSELALFDLPRGSGIRENLELILKSGMRGKDLVKQLLLFSRKSEKKQEIVTLTPMIKETFKLLRASIPTTIQMKLQLETETDTVFADPSQIQQVILNLCTNAAYAMRGTTGSIDICVQSTTFGSNDLPEVEMEPGDYLVLSVKDSGCGMDEEIRKRVFEPFFTTKPPGEGTGLGLSVAFGIIKDHRGNITVYSEPGKGSIFKVYLPKVDTGISVGVEAMQPIPRGSERILFVDDEEIIVNSVRRMLQHLGYTVTGLMDSQEALKTFCADPSQFDLVITDQTMPFMTGQDLGKEMMRIRADIPLILCTGYGESASSEKATAMGFRGFIMKPFTVREAAELVRSVLDQKRSK